MLKLTRRPGELILINNGQIEIKVVSIEAGIVCLGIKAPLHIDVDRKELFLRKKRDRLFAIKKESLSQTNAD